ncbi:hypothetical protein PoB_006804900 [Plakobranchus ocellatus]|uniref:Uncharacterized protein n=1 Tax=Plakobranchus ocellatus TaxID=259542 RepID=A0AAV4DBF4_9GAST|nr:hypothetical protein PoB_006804900 [Plakobranchus ocellatus]
MKTSAWNRVSSVQEISENSDDQDGCVLNVSVTLSDEAWVATVSQPEKTTCGGTVPELLGTALTQRPEGDPTSRGRPTPRGRPYVPRDPASRGRPK